VEVWSSSCARASDPRCPSIEFWNCRYVLLVTAVIELVEILDFD
jgi:hypothetical protein